MDGMDNMIDLKISDKYLPEPLLQNTHNKYVALPIKYKDIRKFYEKHDSTTWRVNDIDLDSDMNDWENLDENTKNFLKYMLAFFAASDGMVNENISTNFASEIQWPEVRSFYAVQAYIEDIHMMMYAKLIVTYIKDPDEHDRLFNAVERMPAIAEKALWAQKWISSKERLAVRLFASMIVEGLFFSGAFLAIYFIAEKKILLGLCNSNRYIARDEALHVQFTQHLLKNYIVNKLTQEEVDSLINEAVEIERRFINEAIPCKLTGMNADHMSEYIEFVAHRLVSQLGYTSKFSKSRCLFGFMDKISLQNQTAFFDTNVTEYKKDNKSKKINIVKFDPDAEF
jgi:ribonucleotide reductase beta subunit family protein with ferritin-like domain